MSVLLILAVTASMLLLNSPVPVSRDTLEKGRDVEVSDIIKV